MPVDDLGAWTPPKLRRRGGNRHFHVHNQRGWRGLVSGRDLDVLERILESKQSRLYEVETITVDIEDHANEAIEKADAAVEALRKRLDQFRSVIGNDLTSIKAASHRVQVETQAMAKRYQEASEILTSPEFERAISNAERMAVALKAISELSDTKLSVAVFNGSGGEG